MPSSNENDAKSISKLALLASAAATAAFVITQTRVMQRLIELAPATSTPPPQPHEPSSEEARPAQEDEPIAELPSGVSQAEDPGDEAPGTDDRDDRDDRVPPPPTPGGGRLRFRTSRPARERLHYGLPVRGRGRRPAIAPAVETHGSIAEAPEATPTAIALLEPPASTPPVVEDEEFDAEYLATVQAITCDGQLDDYDPEYLAIVEAIIRDGRPEGDGSEDAVQTATVTALRTDVEEMWWLPAPRLHYIFIALLYVAIAAAVGSDPVSLALEGVRALATIDSSDDLLLLGWALCGVIVLVPLGAIATRLVSLVTRGKVYLPGVVSPDSIDSAGWGVRLVAVSAFIAGVVLYTPHGLSWALNTDYPVAAVSSSSMSPSLHEGELVLIDGVSSMDQLRVGDIIAFTHEEGIAVRRITGFTGDAVLARADASPDEDFVIPFENVAGRVLTLAGGQVKLPLLGNIALLGERTVEPTASSRPLP